MAKSTSCTSSRPVIWGDPLRPWSHGKHTVAFEVQVGVAELRCAVPSTTKNTPPQTPKPSKPRAKAAVVEPRLNRKDRPPAPPAPATLRRRHPSTSPDSDSPDASRLIAQALHHLEPREGKRPGDLRASPGDLRVSFCFERGALVLRVYFSVNIKNTNPVEE